MLGKDEVLRLWDRGYGSNPAAIRGQYLIDGYLDSAVVNPAIPSARRPQAVLKGPVAVVGWSFEGVEATARTIDAYVVVVDNPTTQVLISRMGANFELTPASIYDLPGVALIRQVSVNGESHGEEGISELVFDDRRDLYAMVLFGPLDTTDPANAVAFRAAVRFARLR